MNNYVDNPFQSPAVLSICTGMRGLERGLERAIGPIRTVAYVEIEAFIIYNLVRQMEQGVVDAAPVWANLKTFPYKAFYRKVHGIIGGYPCQPFSLAGKRAGENDERHLWPYIEQLIAATRPVWCFFENVDDHLTLGYTTVYKSLRDMGYTVEADVYSADEAGAPHERKRLFILAVENTHVAGLRRQYKGGFQPKAQRTGEELEHAYSGRKQEPLQCQQAEQALTGTWNASDELADTWSKRGQLQINGQQSAKQFVGWPAPQGSYQYEWEEPRTVEPGVGCTINGYNFRNDLLRMYGNGVVEQTAEIAFIDLINKFFK